MAITSSKQSNEKAFKQAGFWQDEVAGLGAVNVEGLVQLADSDGEVIDPSTGAAAATGGGTSTYSTAQGDFTATPTVETTNITVTGLPFTLEAQHVVNGAIKKIASDGTVTVLDTSNISVSGGVITLSEEDNFVSGDSVVVSVTGPDKAYDPALDANLVHVLNPDYANYTSPETLIAEEDQADAAVSRYVVPFEQFKHFSLQYSLFADTADDTVTMTFWGTNDADADDTADTGWIDMTNQLFGVASVAANNATEAGMWIIDTSVRMLKFMVKLVYAYGGGVSANNSADVIIVKGS